MSYTPCFDLANFPLLSESWKRGQLAHLIEVLILGNRGFIRTYPKTPKLYDAGIVYDFNHDRWQDIPSCILHGSGDCKDLTGWRVAELREQGELRAAPHVTLRTEGDLTIYHVMVRRADGSIEDPSRILGMGAQIVA